MICEGPVRGFAIRQEANWNKFSSCWVMSQFKRRSDTLGVSSDCAMQSTITSGRLIGSQLINQSGWGSLNGIVSVLRFKLCASLPRKCERQICRVRH
jgi:hypothetical protein